MSSLPNIPELDGADNFFVPHNTISSYDDINDVDGTKPNNNNNNIINQFRLQNRLRRWHVTFGNPALGTYDGSIVTIHPRSKKRRQHLLLGDENDEGSDDETENDPHEEDDDSSDDSSVDSSFYSCSSTESSVGEEENLTQRIAVMTDVEPHQVPDGIINLVRSHRPFIEQVRIVIGSARMEEAEYRRRRRETKAMRDIHNEKPTNMRRSRSQTWACEGGDENEVNGYTGTTSLKVASIRKLDVSDKSNSKRLNRGRSTSLDTSALYDNLYGRYDKINNATTDFGEEKEEEVKYSSSSDDDHRENEDKNYHILFVLDSKESTDTFVSDLDGRPYTSLDENEICSVYPAAYVKGEDGVSLLGPFFASSATSNDKQIGEPSSTKDEHQCPVCLDPLAAATSSDASSSILTTVCNHSFHIDCLARWQDSPCPVCRYDHSGLNETLSRCHVCATTVRNYVCLICGVISCSNGPSSSWSSPSIGEGANQPPQAPSHLGHALQHYEDTLHAYALDTETQHVWDFAGNGYVHRLLNSEDGKIVEGTDPQLMEEERGHNLLNGGDIEGVGQLLPLTALERSSIPTYLTSSEDDEVIHRKLEGFAGQYYTLLKSQLEQQRIFYEGRLEAIRREHETKRNELVSTAELISALKQERNQIEQRCMTLRRKHKKVSDDAMFLENMNESLESDKHAFRKQIADAQAALSEAKQLNQQILTPLEEKVNLLMLQLENGVGGGGDDLDVKKPQST